MSPKTVATAWPRRLLNGVDATATPSLSAHRHIWGDVPELAANEVIAAAQDAGLVGKGGAAFPVSRKLRTVAAGRGPAVVVANGAEGEPASAKDRLLLKNAPHLVLDGIQLAARAVRADRCFLVAHADVAASVRGALRERADRVPVDVRELPSPYVASEETAVVHWLNGGEAKPTFTPPRPYEAGVDRRPTLVNNVETLAHLATIARHGPEWFRSVGDGDEPGTRLVTVTGASVQQRVAEVPTGVRIGDILTATGIDDADTAALLVGGYFGTWLPFDLACQLPLTHHALSAAGGGAGPGIVVALPTHTCGLRESARVAAYLAANNAGQCGPCLNGLPAIATALRRLVDGSWDDRLWPMLERWLTVVPGRGACRHPDGAVRFVASALTVFADDVARHRNGQPCPRVAGQQALLPLPAARVLTWR